MEKLSRNIVLALEKLYHVQRSLMWDVGKIEKLSPVQIQFLIYIDKYPGNLCKVSVLAKDFDLTKATVSDAISSLENKNLIAKIVDKADKRSFRIELTSKGKKVAKRILKWSEIITSSVDIFSSDQKKTVLIFLMELIKALYDEGVINVPKLCITCSNFERDIKPNSNTPHRCNLTGHYVADNNLNIGCSNFKN